MEYWNNLLLENLQETFEGILYVEEWRPIKGYEDMYEVSNFGRIKGLERMVAQYNGRMKKIKERIIRIQKATNDYLLVSLWKENKNENKVVHRIVGEAFIPNNENLPEINHKKGVKYDNRAHQLEWSTKSNNIKHSYDVLNRRRPAPMQGKTGSLHPNSKKVYCPTLGLYFESSRIAEKELGISQGTISDLCNGKQLQRDGLVLNYA